MRPVACCGKPRAASNIRGRSDAVCGYRTPRYSRRSPIGTPCAPERLEPAFHGHVVVAIALRAHLGGEPMRLEAACRGSAGMLGGLKRLSQHFEGRGYDGCSKAMVVAPCDARSGASRHRSVRKSGSIGHWRNVTPCHLAHRHAWRIRNGAGFHRTRSRPSVC